MMTFRVVANFLSSQHYVVQIARLRALINVKAIIKSMAVGIVSDGAFVFDNTGKRVIVKPKTMCTAPFILREND